MEKQKTLQKTLQNTTKKDYKKIFRTDSARNLYGVCAFRAEYQGECKVLSGCWLGHACFRRCYGRLLEKLKGLMVCQWFFCCQQVAWGHGNLRGRYWLWIKGHPMNAFNGLGHKSGIINKKQVLKSK